jgi:PBP1b-binding outer membrane lipoprotein LpoB
MKKLVLLFAALLVAGCGEESSSEGSDSASENPSTPIESVEPSADTAKPRPAEPPVAESPSENPSTPSEDVKEETKVTTRLDNEKIAPLMIKSIIDPLIPKP